MPTACLMQSDPTLIASQVITKARPSLAGHSSPYPFRLPSRMNESLQSDCSAVSFTVLCHPKQKSVLPANTGRRNAKWISDLCVECAPQFFCFANVRIRHPGCSEVISASQDTGVEQITLSHRFVTLFITKRGDLSCN